MEDILKSNFIDSIKGAQKVIVFGCVLSVLLFILASQKNIGLIKIPGLNLEAQGKTGLFIILILYSACGLLLAFYLNRAKKNLAQINSDEVKSALSMFPGFVCGSLFTRVVSCLTPVLIFALAMNEAYTGNHSATWLMLVAFSMPYVIAISIAVEVKP